MDKRGHELSHIWEGEEGAEKVRTVKNVSGKKGKC